MPGISEIWRVSTVELARDGLACLSMQGCCHVMAVSRYTDKMSYPSLPYSAIIIDSSYSRLLFAVQQCLTFHSSKNRREYENTLHRLWTTRSSNQNSVLPCLCVRTALDLFLRVKNYPKGSEVIMSAVNIRDMAYIVRHHGLRVVPVDISIDTLEPRLTLLENLITHRTVAVLVAHLYGRVINMDPVISLARKYGLAIIEDCAECFSGFSKIGHPESDIALFSFGIIKFSTSFGGAIAKVRDEHVYEDMSELHLTYPTQTGLMYLKKILKYIPLYSILQVWPWPQFIQKSREMGVDWKDTFVSYLRGFPDNLIQNIRYQPSSALLSVMASVQLSFSPADFDMQRIKGDYFLSNLPHGLKAAGTKVKINNFWLFPVVVDDPDLFVSCLAALGVDAYRGATQLNVIEPDEPEKDLGPNLVSGKVLTAHERFPHSAKYLIDHVVYMPVNKFVPFHIIDQMTRVCKLVVLSMSGPSSRALTVCKSLVKSKL